MDGRVDEVAFLVSSIGRSIGDLRRGVGAGRGPHVSRGGSLRTYVSAALDAIEARAEQLLILSRSAAPPDLDAIANQLRLINQHLRTLHICTGWIADARASSLGLGLIYFFEEAAEVLLKNDSELVVRPHHDYGYSTIGLDRPFRAILRDVGSSLPPGPSPVLINYPALEVDRVLLHPIFVHELGHQTVEQEDLRNAVLSKHPNIKKLEAKFSAAVTDIVNQHAAHGDVVIPTEIESQLREMLNRWIDELLCDAIAVAYMGPSFLFAAGAFLLQTAKDRPSPTHPPSTLRVRWALDALAKTKWVAELKVRMPAIVDWLEWVGAPTPASPSDHIGTFLLGAIDELKTALSRVVRARLAGNAFVPSKYALVGGELESLLSDRLPPVQLADGSAAGRREIILASWLSALAATGNEPSSLSRALADTDLQRFYSRAIEMSFVLERWSKS